MAQRKTLADFNGDQSAFDKWLKENPEPQQSPNSEEAPASETIAGVITGCSESAINFNGGSKGRFINISGEDGNILISEALYQSNKLFLKVGQRVKITVERRISGVTGYLDSNKESRTYQKWQLHKSSGLGFQKVELNEEQAIAASTLAMKTADKVSGITSIMDEISKRIGDAPEHLATAFSGAFSALRS